MPPTHLHGYQTFKTGDKILYSCTRCGWERIMDIEKVIEEILDDPKTKEILEALGPDYDEMGIPYWDKWSS